jgi:hypothetical protein
VTSPTRPGFQLPNALEIASLKDKFFPNKPLTKGLPPQLSPWAPHWIQKVLTRPLKVARIFKQRFERLPRVSFNLDAPPNP